jgi:hypothetical protein
MPYECAVTDPEDSAGVARAIDAAARTIQQGRRPAFVAPPHPLARRLPTEPALGYGLAQRCHKISDSNYTESGQSAATVHNGGVHKTMMDLAFANIKAETSP